MLDPNSVFKKLSSTEGQELFGGAVGRNLEMERDAASRAMGWIAQNAQNEIRNDLLKETGISPSQLNTGQRESPWLDVVKGGIGVLGGILDKNKASNSGGSSSWLDGISIDYNSELGDSFLTDMGLNEAFSDFGSWDATNLWTN